MSKQAEALSEVEIAAGCKASFEKMLEQRNDWYKHVPHDALKAIHDYAFHAGGEFASEHDSEAFATLLARVAERDAEIERVQTLERQVVGILGRHRLPNALAIGERLDKRAFEVNALTAQLRAAEQERLSLARAYDPNCDEYHCDEQLAAMIAARQTVEVMQELATFLGRDPEGCLSDVPDEAMGKIETAESESTALREQLDQARQQCTELAKQAGLAQGELAASKMAGIVREWKDRAERAEGELAKMRPRAERIITAFVDYILKHSTLCPAGAYQLVDSLTTQVLPTAAAKEGE